MDQFQSESWRTTIQMEMSCAFLCKSNLFSLSIVEHQDSLQNRDIQQLENGLLPLFAYIDDSEFLCNLATDHKWVTRGRSFNNDEL